VLSLSNEINVRLIKNYILKRYVIVNLHPSINQLFDFYEYESSSVVSNFMMMNYLCDIFSVDRLMVKEIFSQIIKEKRKLEELGKINI